PPRVRRDPASPPPGAPRGGGPPQGRLRADPRLAALPARAARRARRARAHPRARSPALPPQDRHDPERRAPPRGDRLPRAVPPDEERTMDRDEACITETDALAVLEALGFQEMLPGEFGRVDAPTGRVRSPDDARVLTLVHLGWLVGNRREVLRLIRRFRRA